MAFDYDPENRAHRQALAARIIAEAERLGMTQEPSNGELIFSRQREPTVKVMLYSSIVGGEVRGNGEDAIRVATVYTGEPKRRGLSAEQTIHRRGTITKIAGRIEARVSAAMASEIKRCSRCNAPAFKARSGSPTCAALCWMQHVTPVVAAPEPVPVTRTAPRVAVSVEERVPAMRTRRARGASTGVPW